MFLQARIAGRAQVCVSIFQTYIHRHSIHANDLRPFTQNSETDLDLTTDSIAPFSRMRQVANLA